MTTPKPCWALPGTTDPALRFCAQRQRERSDGALPVIPALKSPRCLSAGMQTPGEELTPSVPQRCPRHFREVSPGSHQHTMPQATRAAHGRAPVFAAVGLPLTGSSKWEPDCADQTQGATESRIEAHVSCSIRGTFQALLLQGAPEQELQHMGLQRSSGHSVEMEFLVCTFYPTVLCNSGTEASV